MSSSGDDSETDFVFYKDRPEWNDVQPIPEVKSQVIQIIHTDKWNDVYGYFRAILKANEISPRVLELTKDAILLNPANYTVWECRRNVLKHLNSNLWDELEFLEEVIEDNLKNYQVWHHRQVIIEWLGDPKLELNFTSQMLKEDAKNYHAWQYRQWVLIKFGLWDVELPFVNTLLFEDPRNNSAWNQRYFVITHTTGFTTKAAIDEIKFALQAIDQLKKNESAWNYLRGILKHVDDGLLYPLALDFCENLYRNGCRSPCLLAYLVDALKQQLNQSNSDGKAASLDRALHLCTELAEKYDMMRHKYWNYVASSLKESFPSVDTAL